MSATKQALALRTIADGILEIVSMERNGLPAGVLYAILMGQGCTRQQFDSIIGAMTGAGLIQRKGDLLLGVKA